MEATQLRKLLESFSSFAEGARGEHAQCELRAFASVLPQTGRETVSAFVKKVKKNRAMQDYTIESPKDLHAQIESIANILEHAKATASRKDVLLLLTLFDGPANDDARTFLAAIRDARDYVTPERTAAPRSASAKPDQVVAEWVQSLNAILLSPQEFGDALERLKRDKKISDARVKKIAKTLSGRTAKTRDEALSSILQHQNKEALAIGSYQSLQAVRA